MHPLFDPLQPTIEDSPEPRRVPLVGREGKMPAAGMELAMTSHYG
jgi:hypothetical protein